MNEPSTGDQWDWEYSIRDLPARAPLPIVDVVTSHASVDARILYIGVGEGRNFLPLARAGYNVYGCDVSRVSIDRLVSANPDLADRLVHGTFESAFPSRGGFDVVVASRVLIEADTNKSHELLLKVLPLLSPRGLLISEWTAVGTDPWPGWDDSFLDSAGNLTLHYDSERIRKKYLSFNGCANLLEGAGFEIEQGPTPIDLPRSAYPGGIVRDWISVARATSSAPHPG